MIYLVFFSLFPSREQLPLLVPAELQKRPCSSAATFNQGTQTHQGGRGHLKVPRYAKFIRLMSPYNDVHLSPVSERLHGATCASVTSFGLSSPESIRKGALKLCDVTKCTDAFSQLLTASSAKCWSLLLSLHQSCGSSRRRLFRHLLEDDCAVSQWLMGFWQ